MSSKDKLIEFLKSAQIEYEQEDYSTAICIKTGSVKYYFWLDGQFFSSEGY